MPTTPCRHLHTDGRQCGSPALRGEPFCFYHHTARKPMPRRTGEDHAIPQLPAPEDFLAIQRGIGEVLRLLANDSLPERLARTLLAGLAAASANLARHHRRDANSPAGIPVPSPVTDFVNDPTHGTLAPEPNPQPGSNNQHPLPDPIPLLTPDPSPNTSYDDAKLVEIHTRYQTVFREKLQRFEQQKCLELQTEYEIRYTEREAELEARHAALLQQPTPDTPQPSKTSPQQNQYFRTFHEHEKDPAPLALALAG